jgi:hypothetical protein
MHFLKVKIIIAGLISAMCMFGAAWAGFHLFFLATDHSPIEISEPNLWLARFEFLFALLIALLGLSGAVFINVRWRQGSCPLCGSDIHNRLPIPRRETANSSDKTPPIRAVHTEKIADVCRCKGAADA